jgi:hypothetical protein
LDGFLYATKRLGGVGVARNTFTASNMFTAVAPMLQDRIGFGVVTIGSTGPDEEQNLFDALSSRPPREILFRRTFIGSCNLITLLC